MSLNPAKMQNSLKDQLDQEEEALRTASAREVEEAKIKASKKPAINKLKK
jgi:hypothetical protein